ncbi:uncharacterized protein LOC142344500 isoform X3 [Convolutriloba macropyga]|uniref:uncharacterized protein LOC142344500 isoform X3 n=1 Tax=Convolutriloba macropyga TaxID=536237 RepID=UPI003F525E53
MFCFGKHSTSKIVINGQDVSRLDEARAGQIFMQAEEPISVKVKRRGGGGINSAISPHDNSAELSASKSTSSYNESSQSEQHSENDLLSPSECPVKEPTAKESTPRNSPKHLCSECQKRKAVQTKSVSVQTEENAGSEIEGKKFEAPVETDIWLRDPTFLGNKQSNYGDVRYKDLMSHEDVYGNLDELEDDEEAIYEDLYNHIMPLPSPFNLVEYEDVVIGKTGNKLGMTLCHGNDDIFGVFISSLEPNGVAARTGSLQIGDQILQINETLIETKEQALTLFNAVKTSDIKVTVARSKQQMYEEILFTDDPSSPLTTLFPIMEKSSDNRTASSNCSSPRIPNSASGNHLHKMVYPQSYNTQNPTPIPHAVSPVPPEIPERSSPVKGLMSSSKGNENSSPVNRSQAKTPELTVDSHMVNYPELPRPSSKSKDENNSNANTAINGNEKRHSSPVKKLGAGKLQPQSRNINSGDVPGHSSSKTNTSQTNKQNLLVSNERFDSSGYCSSNINSPKMLTKLSHSPSIASSIAQHGKQYRSYLKLIKLKDEDSVYGVPLGLMPDIKDENTRSPKNRDSMVSSHSRNRRTASQIRQRAQKIKEETLILTTDDETISELKIGKFWTKQERKRQFLVAKEHKQRRYMMERSRALYRDIQNAKKLGSSGSSGNEVGSNEKVFTTLSKKEIKEKKEKILDNFWTIQELLAHGGRMADGSLHPLLSVTTV